jgi:O-acetyl-ADP-ribose deacetylase (regulator of RNase III)
MSPNPEILTFASALAVGSLLAGLCLFGWIVLRKNTPHFYATTVICWLLLAMFPGMLLFLIFPNSSAESQLLDFKISGAAAFFIIVWVLGVRYTNNARERDQESAELHEHLERAEAEIERLEKSMAINTAGRKPKPIDSAEILRYSIKDRTDRCVALVPGAIERVRHVDVWVNSENTNMQMARYFEGSLSGTIRYLGARRDDAGNVTDDSIGNELGRVLGDRVSVQPGSVFVTGAGELERTHNVKRIFHVASVQGQFGRGYRQIDDIGCCVTRALEKADSAELVSVDLSSILIPLVGTGRGGGDLKETAEQLLLAAVNYLQTTDRTRLRCVYFLTWTDVELAVCRAVLDAIPEVVAEKGANRRNRRAA